MLVKPRAGVKVHREVSPHEWLPDEATEVPETSYYVRQVQAGDLVVVPAPNDQPGRLVEKSKGGGR